MEGIITFFQNIFQQFYDALIPGQRYLDYLNGLKITLLISFFAIIIGVVIGVVVAITRVFAANANAKWYLKVFDKICGFYITIIRGTPVMLQLMIIYNMIFTSRGTSEVMVAAICFGLNSGAYVAEIIRAGIVSIDKGQTEAGRSLGLSNVQTMRLIIVPQAIKNILPALGNEFIVLIKETSVASVIAITDIMNAAKYIGSATYQPLPPYIIAAVIYLTLVIGLTKLLRMFERRLGQSDNH